MNRSLLTLAGIGFLAALVGCESTAPSSSASKANKVGPPVKTAKVSKPKQASTQQANRNEFRRLPEELNMNPEETKKMLAAADEFDRKVKLLGESPVGKAHAKAVEEISAAKDSGDEKKLAEARARNQAANDAYQAQRTVLRAEVLNLLTPEQKVEYVTRKINLGVRHASIYKTKVTEDQRAKIQALCSSAAKAFVKPDTFSKDPYLVTLAPVTARVVDEIKTNVLTAEQRQTLEARPTSTPPAKKGKK